MRFHAAVVAAVLARQVTAAAVDDAKNVVAKKERRPKHAILLKKQQQQQQQQQPLWSNNHRRRLATTRHHPSHHQSRPLWARDGEEEQQQDDMATKHEQQQQQPFSSAADDGNPADVGILESPTAATSSSSSSSSLWQRNLEEVDWCSAEELDEYECECGEFNNVTQTGIYTCTNNNYCLEGNLTRCGFQSITYESTGPTTGGFYYLFDIQGETVGYGLDYENDVAVDCKVSLDGCPCECGLGTCAGNDNNEVGIVELSCPGLPRLGPGEVCGTEDAALLDLLLGLDADCSGTEGTEAPSRIRTGVAKNSSDTGIIVGGAVGGLAVVAIATVLVVYFACRKTDGAPPIQNQMGGDESPPPAREGPADQPGLMASDGPADPRVAVASVVSPTDQEPLPRFKDQVQDARRPEAIPWATAKPKGLDP